MGLDIRVPLGLIFLAVGGLLAGFGLYTHADAALYARSLGVNLNLGWGLMLFLFGAVMLYVGRRQRWQDDPVDPRPWERGPATKTH